MPNIEIDAKTYAVKSGENLLQTVLSLGLNLPYFCWHPAMGSVGACRQCAVIQFNDQDDQHGRLVMACMTPVTDGMRVSLEAPAAREFRADILELLMTNHPHDCPVCEEGGECHLQDMTVMTGHTSRQYRNEKRTHRNQYLGPFINHEMNRCIACYRCVRYYQDYAGGDDLQVFSSHNNVYFGRHEEGVLENEFSGNLVEVCPTGVFTDKTFSQHYARKWDLQAAPSICVHCSLGCNISPGERYGELRRVVNRYHGDINGYFLCDRGRFGYDFVNSSKRLRKPLIKNQQVINKQAAIQHYSKLKGIAIGIGSPRASIEANFALRELVGVENFYQGLAKQEQDLLALAAELLQNAPAKIATLREVEQADAVVIIGEDITNTAPRLALSVRQAVRNRAVEIADQLHIEHWQDAAVRSAAQQERSPLFIISCDQTRLDDVATNVYRGSPDRIARVGFAMANSLDSAAPAVKGLTRDDQDWIAGITKILRTAQRPLIITGTGCQSRAVIEAAVNLLKSLSAADKAMSLVVPECNSIGLALLGGENFTAAAQRLESGAADTLVVLENDLYRRGSERLINDYLASAKHVVVIDHLHHATADKAELVLPAATFAETEGTLINAEGRAQRYFSVLPPADYMQGSWQWLCDLGANNDWHHIDDISTACSKEIAAFAPIIAAAPDEDFRLAGMKIPRQPHRYSGRTAMRADVNVSEPKQPEDDDSALAFSMEGTPVNRPPALNPVVWAPSWNSNQAVNKFQDEVGGHLKGGDPGICLFTNVTDVLWNTTIPAPAKKGTAPIAAPLYHIFGSEELSVNSPSLAERICFPYVAVNAELAAALSVTEGEAVEINSAEYSCRLPAKITSGLADGIIGIPAGFSGLPTITFNTAMTLKKCNEQD